MPLSLFPREFACAYRRRLASRSDSSRQRMSFSRTVMSPLVCGGFVQQAGRACVPGPLTLRMMERVWSFMNSTRHWVTPPREPVIIRQPAILSRCASPNCCMRSSRRKVRGLRKVRVPVRPRTRVTLTRLTGALAESILCGCEVRRESVVRCAEELGWAFGDGVVAGDA